MTATVELPYRSTGTTASEQRLAWLCGRAFLSLWSYPNIYRDQGKSGAGHGKEVCDLLVVFGDDVIIFSDKQVSISTEKSVDIAWPRWVRAAVIDSAQQAFGAERWIRSFPNRLFLDRECQRRIPISIPSGENVRYHRVVVARGATEACAKFHGGSGSLMLVSEDAIGPHIKPYMVGQPFPGRGFVHVVDEKCLDLILQHLDTISDFVGYLRAKEELFTTRHFFAAGEEELLAKYLTSLESDGTRGFRIPSTVDAVVFQEGLWIEHQETGLPKARLDANRPSYAWDRLIEKFSFHIETRTQEFATEREVSVQEGLMRWMARESRLRRRMLAKKILSMAESTRTGQRFGSFLPPTTDGDPYWVFAVLPDPHFGSYEEYRVVRREFLHAYCLAVKLRCPDALDVVGIAINSLDEESMTEDAIYLDLRQWDDQLQREAEELQKELGLFDKAVFFKVSEKEYPNHYGHPPRMTRINITAVPSEYVPRRNEKCPCGSGKRFKQCCQRDYEHAQLRTESRANHL